MSGPQQQRSRTMIEQNLRDAIVQHDDAHAAVATEREARYLREWQQADAEIKRLRAQFDVSIIPGLVERVQWAAKQCDAALEDSRIDGADSAWLRTIKQGLTNASGDLPTGGGAKCDCANCNSGIPHKAASAPTELQRATEQQS